MKHPQTILSENHKILRNGKIITPKKTPVGKKKKMLDLKKGDKLFKTNPNLQFRKKNDSLEMAVTDNCSHSVDNHSLYLLLEKIPSLINDVQFNNNNNNNNNNKNCYTNLEDFIELNELQIYNELQPKILSKVQLISKVKSEETVIPLNSVNKKKHLKTKPLDHLVSNQNNDVRMTRGKTIRLQREERKKLDKIIFDKYPNNTFKMFAIRLDDITEEVKFLKTLGLICRFKCPLSPAKLKTRQ